ncbi:D-alanyl-D-alanine endopeptidase [Niveibacterium sp. 24ML]|uniref:D-alanyl-D-alanine endopeptidase n=1 Tax=Niveibacterium sp. 24ML TaxID=2985512 RepID=UPI002B4C22F8|nr:D-alanyl-D-alanine endopeptidase [Niveibacterium sp. 24ML]
MKRETAARALYRDTKSAKAAPLRIVNEVDRDGNPLLMSNAFIVQEVGSGKVLLERNATSVLPIASITKLMTAMVVLDAKLSLSEPLTITEDDTDKLKFTSSRLIVGTTMTREELIHLALMSSENRAAAALGRNYPGGIEAFIAAMNQKAASLGLVETTFHDSTGLNPHNVSSARDLARMVTAATHYPLIREFSTDDEEIVDVRGRAQTFRNTNGLVKSPDWQIGLSKTGFINEAGRCLVMQAWLADKPMVIVLLDSVGKFTRVADAQRIKRWIEGAVSHQAQLVGRVPAG